MTTVYKTKNRVIVQREGQRITISKGVEVPSANYEAFSAQEVRDLLAHGAIEVVRGAARAAPADADESDIRDLGDPVKKPAPKGGKKASPSEDDL